MKTAELGHKQQTDQTDRRLVAGRYRLLARIGRGRLGEIYEADDEGYRELGVGRHVAIQLLPERVALDRGLFSKLKLGYTVLRTVSHPNIVTFSDFHHDGKFGYLVMDLLEGASLRFILDDVTTLPLDEAIPVIRAIGDALQFLHAKSMTHGKLIAENVFVTETFEVRLLDVVPLNAAPAILPGAPANDPFSRCDVGGDVYGLACLTYEILAGKHPFNFHAPAEARLAKLEPARIDSLPEKQWNAIRRGLSFDPEQQILSVADFLSEFGVKGTERLRPSEDATAKRESSSSHPVNELPTTTHSAESYSGSPASAPVAPATRSVADARREDALELARAKGKRARRMPSPVLMIALVGLAAWFFYGQPRDDVVRPIDYVDSYLNAKSPGSGDVGLPLKASDPGPVTPSDVASTIIPTADSTKAVAADDARAETIDGTLVAEDTASGELTASAVDDLASTSDIDQSSRSEPEFTLIQSVAYVSERDGAARITTRHPGDTVGQVFWWTSDNTAIAENDYIPIDQPVEGFASGEEYETMLIPLVNDSLPEPQETFYVHLGRHNAQLGRLESISRVRVEINDDD